MKNENEDLKKDFEQYSFEHLNPINQKNIEQEKNRHDKFLEKHGEKYEKLSEKHSAFIFQLITLQSVILTAIVLFSNPEDVTVWIILAICSILVSLFFGVWLQNLSIQADYQNHQWEYKCEMESHWWSRKLWKDNTVEEEKKLFESELKEMDDRYMKTFTYKVLKFLHLNHDRIENIFKITFLISLLLLIIHYTYIPFNNRSNSYKRPLQNKSYNFKFNK